MAARRLLALLLATTLSVAAADTPPEPRSVNAIMRPVEALRTDAEKAILAWLEKEAHPFPANPTSAELAPLLDALGDARLVGIGEITHGTHEDLAFKSALLRALVERGDLRVIAFEVNRRTGLALDRFVAGEDDRDDVAAVIKDARVYEIWRTHELADLLRWLRGWNAKVPARVRIVGVDVQDASHDFSVALERLGVIDKEAAARFSKRLAPWITKQALARHQIETIATFDRPRWEASRAAALELEALLAERDAEGHDAAQAARHAIEMMESDLPGYAETFLDIPDDVASRRDIAMADRLVASLPETGRAALWAHDSHVARIDSPPGFGFVSQGARLHERLGRKAYKVVTFSARVIDFNAKFIGADRASSRKTPMLVWRYESTPADLATFLSRTGRARFWFDLDRLPASEAGIVFRFLPYGRGGFGWGLSDPAYPMFPGPLGYGSDIVVHFDRMTPSRRL